MYYTHIAALIKGSPPPAQVVSSLPVSRGVLQLWQVKLAGAALSGPSGEGRGLLARGYTDGLLLRLKSFLDQATAQWGGEGGGKDYSNAACLHLEVVYRYRVYSLRVTEIN